MISFFKRYSWLVDLCFLTILISLLYFLWLGHYPLFTPDEGRYPEVAREMLTTKDFITPRVNGIVFLDKPVLYYWLEALAMAVFGVTEWGVRFFPALLGIAGCLCTYVCGRFIFNRKTGLMAAAMLATTPLYFACAHYADLNLEVAVFISATLLCLITALRDPTHIRRPFLMAAYCFTALAFLTKGLISVAFPGLIMLIWLLMTKQLTLLKKISIPTGIVIFLLIVSPWYLLAQQANPDFFHYFFITQQVSRFLSHGEFNNPTPWWFYLPVILIGFFPWAIFLLQSIYSAIKNYFLSPVLHQTELFLLLWFVVILAFFSIPHSKTIGYILPVFPALSLLTANYLTTQWEKQHNTAYLFMFSAFLFAGLLFLVTQIDTKFTIHLTHYLSSIIILFLLIGTVSWFLRYQKTILPIISLFLIANVIFLASLPLQANYINDHSTKAIALSLKKIIQPNDIVISYFQFPQDIPMYLNRTILIAANWNEDKIMQTDNWQRELWLGVQFQKNRDGLLNENEFWQKWNSQQRVYVFVAKNYWEQFSAQTKHYVLINKTDKMYLVRND